MPQKAHSSPEKLLKELRAAIAACPNTADKDRTRYFTRHHLHMPAQQFKRVIQWFKNPTSMTYTDMELVRQTLNRLNDQRNTQPPTLMIQRDEGNTRDVVDHTISLLSSLSTFVAKAQIKRSSVYDGDRMRIQSCMQRLCESLGVPANFPDLGKRMAIAASDLSTPHSKRNAK